MTERGDFHHHTAHIHRRLFRLALGVRSFLTGMAVLSMLTAVVVIGQMYLISELIAGVFLFSLSPGMGMLVIILLVILVRGLLTWLRERLAQQNAVKVKSAMRMKLFKHLLDMGPVYTRTGKTGELVALLTEGVEKYDDYFTKYIPSVIHIVILPVVIIVFTFYIDWISGLILLVTAPLILFFMWLIGTYARIITQQQWGALSSMSSQFLDALQGIKTLKIFGMSKQEAGNVATASNRFRLITMSVLKVAFLSGMVLELAASISIALVAVQVGIRLIEGMMDYQPALFVLLLAPEFYLPFRTLGQHHHAGMEGAAAAEMVFGVLDKEAAPKKVKLAYPTPSRGLHIDLAGLGYTYPGSSLPALNGIHHQLRPGTCTAIVGHTGSGKTTLVYLLLGFLHPTSGEVLVNNVSIHSHDMEQWRNSVAFVPQHPHFFNATVLDNLLLANPHASMKQVIDACRLAGADSLIEQLPEGYHAMLHENAARLSGGERQRLAIARAFLKDAPVLILDEPTSSLDPESEQVISKALELLIKDRTTLIIAHRLQTVRRADEILVFDRGLLAEHGTHITLLHQRGVYAGFLETLGLRNGGGL